MAVAPRRASTSSTAGVPCACGPSSNVSDDRDASTRRSSSSRSREPRHVRGERRREPDHAHATSASTSDAAEGSAASARPGACRVTSAPRSAPSSSLSQSDDLCDPVTPEGRVVRADVAAAPAVRDRRAAADVRLEHRQPAGRVDERVGRGEPLAHLLGEADQPNAVLVGDSGARAARAAPRFDRRGTRRRSTVEGERRVDRARRDRRRPSRRRRRARPCRRPAGRAPRAPRRGSHGLANSGRVSPCTTWTSRVGTCDLAHLLDRLGMGDEVQVDAGRGPVVHHRQVGDRGHDGDVEPARSAQAAEHLGRHRVDRDDHVGTHAADEPQHAPRSERAHEPPASAGVSARSRRTARRSRPRATAAERKNTTPAAFSLTSTKPRPIARRPSSVTISASGDSARSWSASVRAGRSWPSPTLAVKMRTRVTAGRETCRVNRIYAAQDGDDLGHELGRRERLLDERPLGRRRRCSRRCRGCARPAART